MNANELADELNRKCTGRLIGFAAIMLRQQQADITLLIKNYDLACSEIHKQQAEIEALKEQLHWLVQAPLKELTDEEINEIFNKTWLDFQDYKDFAKAIIRKAQKK